MNHATVKIDGVSIPLIGIDPDETKEKCSQCEKLFHIQDVSLQADGLTFLCYFCDSWNKRPFPPTE